MEAKYSSEQLKKCIEDALSCDINDLQLMKHNINEMVEQVNVYHQELQFQNAELSQTVSQLEILKEKYQTLFSDAPIGYVVFDRNDCIHEANNTFCKMMNIGTHDAHHHKITEFILPHYQDTFYFMKNHVINEGQQEVGELQLRSIENVYDVSMICKPFYNWMLSKKETLHSHFICCAIMDITEMKRQQEKIIDMSYHDAMTGLYNRRFYNYITNRLQKEDSLPLTIATIDLDGLKIINDTLGHEYGDQAIHIVCNILQENANENFILIRMGGDEVIALCPNTPQEDVSRYLSLCEKMIYAKTIEGIPISISYGIATMTNNQENISSISALSEDIMYSHKIMQSPKQKSCVVRKTITRLFEKHPKVREHSERISVMMYNFAKALKLPQEIVLRAEKLGYIHDIGLIAIADPLIVNDIDFNEEEKQEYQRHAQIGNRIIRSLFGFEDIATAVLYHHEHWDGSGYPYGIKNDKIPLLSRMLALADQFDWLVLKELQISSNPSFDHLYEQMLADKGLRFDPELFEPFMEYVKSMDINEYISHKGQNPLLNQ